MERLTGVQAVGRSAGQSEAQRRTRVSAVVRFWIGHKKKDSASRGRKRKKKKRIFPHFVPSILCWWQQKRSAEKASDFQAAAQVEHVLSTLTVLGHQSKAQADEEHTWNRLHPLHSLSLFVMRLIFISSKKASRRGRKQDQSIQPVISYSESKENGHVCARPRSIQTTIPHLPFSHDALHNSFANEHRSARPLSCRPNIQICRLPCNEMGQ